MSMLRLENVSIRLGDRDVVKAVTVAFDAPAMVAIVGPNGAGKTSLLRAIAGLIPFTGRILVDTASLATLSRNDRARTIAYLPQERTAPWPLMARNIVALGRFPHGVADPQRLPPTDAAIVDATMAACDATALADRPITALSGGERARIALARVLAVQAPIILADEPTAALDPSHQLDVQTLLRVAARSALVISVTHDIDHALRFADRVLVMQSGRVIGDGPPDTTLDQRLMAEAFGLRADGVRPRLTRL